MLIQLLFQTCFDKIKENIGYVMDRVYDLLTTNPVGGQLIDVIRKEGMAGAFELMKDYVVTNAAAFAAAALAASPLGGAMAAVFQMIQTAMAMFMSLFDDAILFMLKLSARKALELLETKSIILDKAEHEFIICYNILVSLTAGDPVYEEYLDQLRRAIIELDLGEKDWTLVKNTLSPEDTNIPARFLDRVYDRGKAHIDTARKLITPQTDKNYTSSNWSNGKTKDFFDSLDDDFYIQAGIAVVDPGTAATYGLVREAGKLDLSSTAGLSRETPGRTIKRKAVDNASFILRNVGKPAQQEQMANWGALSTQTKKVASALDGYLDVLARINIQLQIFANSLTRLETELPKLLVKYTAKILERVVLETKSVKEDMAINVNGDKDSIDGPVSKKYTPVIFVLSGLSYVWSARVELIWHETMMIPDQSFKILNLKNEQKEAYNDAVLKLRDLDDIVTPRVTFSARNASENIGTFEAQIGTWLLEAHGALYTFSANDETFEEGRGIIERFSITRARDAEIYSIFDNFIKFQEGADVQMEIYAAQLEETMRAAGVDNLLGSWVSGDFLSVFKMGPETASMIGAALAIFALIQACLDTEDEREELEKTQEKLFALSDLLHIKLDLDLDFNIFKNLQDCIELKGLALNFDLQKFICAVIDQFSDKKTAAGKPEKTIYDKLKAAWHIGTNPGSGLASLISGAGPQATTAVPK